MDKSTKIGSFGSNTNWRWLICSTLI